MSDLSLHDDSDLDVKVEIQKILIEINDVTIKIKRELDQINELTRERGQVDASINNATDSLLKIAKDRALDITNLTQAKDGEHNLSQDAFFNIDANYITEKIMRHLNN